MRLRTTLAALLVLCTYAPISSAEENKVFRGWAEERAVALERVKRVGFLPLRLPASYGERPDVEAALEQMLTKSLAEKFEIIPSSAYAAIFDRLSHDVGGVYNAKTGKADDIKHQALFEHSLRTFIETSGLQATVQPEIVVARAETIGGSSFLDFVIEPTTGKNSFFGKYTSQRGSIPGVSLRLSLYDVNRKLLFAGQAGVQLVAYSGYQDFGGFRYVPNELLLRDPIRLQRAVNLATLGVRKSSEELNTKQWNKEYKSMSDATARGADKIYPPLPEATPPNTSQPFKVPREALLTRTSAIVLEPLGTVGERALFSQYEPLITRELTALGWKVAPTARFREIYKNEWLKVGGTFDVHTGKARTDVIDSIRRNAIMALRKEHPVDALMRVQIVTKMAPYEGLRAEWDGVQQQATDLGPWTGKRLVDNAQWGTIPAMSLEVELKTVEGEVLYQSRGGIQLLQHLDPEKNELVEIPARLLFANAQHHEAAVHAALRALVTPPEVLTAEPSANNQGR